MHFDAVFNVQKTQTVTASHGTWISLFTRETMLTRQCKNYPKFMVRPGGGAVAQSPLHPEYATV